MNKAPEGLTFAARCVHLLLAMQSVDEELKQSLLRELTGLPRTSFARALATLRAGGATITPTKRGRDVHLRVKTEKRGELGPTEPQKEALIMARRALRPAEGSLPVKHLDDLLKAWRVEVPPAGEDEFEPDDAQRARVGTFDTGMRQGRWVGFRYPGSGGVEHRSVRPLKLWISRDQAYTRAWSARRGRERTFKICRSTEVTLLPDEHAPSDAGPERYDPRRRSVWAGTRQPIKVRLWGAARLLAVEHPISKAVHWKDEGETRVLTTWVKGLSDALWWIIPLGGDVEVLSPPRLREMVEAELQKALGRYGKVSGPAPAPAD